MPRSDVFLEQARLGARNPVLIAHDEQPHLAHVKPRFGAYVDVDLAHVVMMVETGVLDARRGARLLEGLLEIARLGAGGFPWVPEVGSCLVQFEHFLAARHGHDIAGRLQTARSRNDQEGAVERFHARAILLENIVALVALERAILALAAAHVDTVMPGYTHLQHAQPWTFGHYLARQGYVLARDIERLRGAFARTDLSALGGAAQAGTSWPIDRRRTAALLGHDGIVMNSNDAGEFARDHLEEGVAALALMMSNVGRFATDLYVWSSWEFALVEVDDGLAGTSSIMPQKKNPHALERAKALAGQAAGWLPSVMACQRGVLSTDLDMVYGDDVFGRAADASRDALALLTEVVRTLVVRKEVMAARADVFWSTASHLADEIVRRFDLDFRSAHHIVGAFVKDSIDAGRSVGEASGARLDEIAEKTIGRALGLDDATLREILDGRAFIHTRVSEGSVNPVHVRAQIEDLDARVTAAQQWCAGAAARIEAAHRELHAVARALAS